jgi:ribosomal protein S18 acetylase RimI-like enzyme
MLHRVQPSDTSTLVAIAATTGVFKPHELVALQEVLDDYHATNNEFGHTAYAWHDESGTIRGFVYYAPTAMTDRTWEIWWIAVDVTSQGQGLGKKLLRWAEEDGGRQGARLMLLETSSTGAYDATRQFYLKQGYVLAAQVPDFYSDGDDKLIFWKRFAVRT